MWSVQLYTIDFKSNDALNFAIFKKHLPAQNVGQLTVNNANDGVAGIEKRQQKARHTPLNKEQIIHKEMEV